MSNSTPIIWKFRFFPISVMLNIAFWNGHNLWRPKWPYNPRSDLNWAVEKYLTKHPISFLKFVIFMDLEQKTNFTVVLLLMRHKLWPFKNAMFSIAEIGKNWKNRNFQIIRVLFDILTLIGKFLRPFYWKTHPSKNPEYLFSF